MHRSVSLIILQAPVSDREAMLLEAAAITRRNSETDSDSPDGFEQLAHALEFARTHALSSNQASATLSCLMTLHLPTAFPLRAQDSTLWVGNDPEDMFSTDLSVEEMTAQIGHVAIQAGVKSMLVFSGADSMCRRSSSQITQRLHGR